MTLTLALFFVVSIPNFQFLLNRTAIKFVSFFFFISFLYLLHMGTSFIINLSKLSDQLLNVLMTGMNEHKCTQYLTYREQVVSNGGWTGIYNNRFVLLFLSQSQLCQNHYLGRLWNAETKNTTQDSIRAQSMLVSAFCNQPKQFVFVVNSNTWCNLVLSIKIYLQEHHIGRKLISLRDYVVKRTTQQDVLKKF